MASRVGLSFYRMLSFENQIRTAPKLSREEQEYANKVVALPLSSICDGGEGEKACRALGQEIFDHFKKTSKGDSSAGKRAMQNIANSLLFICEDGRDRKHNVSRAWSSVGDSDWYWLA